MLLDRSDSIRLLTFKKSDDSKKIDFIPTNSLSLLILPKKKRNDQKTKSLSQILPFSFPIRIAKYESVSPRKNKKEKNSTRNVYHRFRNQRKTGIAFDRPRLAEENRILPRSITVRREESRIRSRLGVNHRSAIETKDPLVASRRIHNFLPSPSPGYYDLRGYAAGTINFN